MILKNSKGTEKHFDILFEFIKNNKIYIVYKDPFTDNVYSGKINNDKLKILEEKEFELIEEILEKFDR